MLDWIVILERQIAQHPEEFIEIGVVIQLPDNLQKQIQDKSLQIHSWDSSEPLSHTPHISLSQGLFKKESLENLKNKIAKIASETDHFPLKTEGSLHVEGHNVFLDIEASKALKNLESQVMQANNTYRYHHGTMKQYRDEIKKHALTADELNQIRENGIPNSGKYFKPHITVSYNLEHSQKITAELTKKNIFLPAEFPLQTIAIYELGYHGNIIKELYAFAVKTPEYTQNLVAYPPPKK